MNTNEIMVISHNDCNDGTAAAWCLNRYNDFALKEENFILLNHGGVEQQLEEKGFFKNLKSIKQLFVLDYSLPISLLHFILENNNSIQITEIDHHKTFWERSGDKETTTGVLEELKRSGRYTYLFDNRLSGAVLTYLSTTLDREDLDRVLGIEDEEILRFHLDDIVPRWLLCIQDRDIWLWRYPESKAFCETFYLAIRNPMNVILDKEIESKYERFINQGEALVEAKAIQLDILAEHAIDIRIRVNGERVKGKFVNCNKFFTSELGNLLLKRDEETKFVISTEFTGEYWKCGIRSTKDFDSTLISKHFGGGGHFQASGFRVPDPMKMLETLTAFMFSN